MCNELSFFQGYETEEKGTVLAHRVVIQGNQLPEVMSPVGTEVNSIPGVAKSSSTWKFPWNSSEVSNEGIYNNTRIKLLTVQCTFNCTVDTDITLLMLMMIRYQLRALY